VCDGKIDEGGVERRRDDPQERPALKKPQGRSGRRIFHAS